jgi:hypothetical protein
LNISVPAAAGEIVDEVELRTRLTPVKLSVPTKRRPRRFPFPPQKQHGHAGRRLQIADPRVAVARDGVNSTKTLELIERAVRSRPDDAAALIEFAPNPVALKISSELVPTTRSIDRNVSRLSQS